MASHPPKLKPLTRRPNAPPERNYGRDEFVGLLLGMEGRSIRTVRYYDNCVTRGYDAEYWDRYGALCDIIYSVELVLDDGEVLAIASNTVTDRYTGVRWLAKDVPDYLGLQGANFSILETDDCLKYDVGDVWDVTHHSRWMDVLRVPIAGVRIYYGPSLVGRAPSTDACVMDLALDFVNGRSVYLAGHASELAGQTLYRQGGDVVVVFGEEGALTLGVGDYADPAWMEHSHLAPTIGHEPTGPGLSPTLGRSDQSALP